MDEPTDVPPKILMDAMNTWIGAQRQAVDLMVSAPRPGHPVDWAEGFRWVTRIAALSQEHAIEYADAYRPTIFRSQGPIRKLMVDNPDVNYYFVHLDEHETYRLTGVRGGAPAIGLTVGTDILRGAGIAVGTALHP